eukprot:SAG31_NODE_25_length_33055_cov_11.407919_5_plen_533_part_00
MFAALYRPALPDFFEPEGISFRHHLSLSKFVVEELNDPAFEVMSKSFYEDGVVPERDSGSLKQLSLAVWGCDDERGEHLLYQWFQSKLRLISIKENFSALEPEGWDQLRRCVACLMAATGSCDPVRELVLAYLFEKDPEGNIANPLVPEAFAELPVELSQQHVQKVLQHQSALNIEDRELILGAIILICVVSGSISDLTCIFIEQLHRASLPHTSSAAASIDHLASKVSLTEAKELAAEFRNMKRSIFFRDIVNLLAGNSVFTNIQDPSQINLRFLMGLRRDAEHRQRYAHYSLSSSHPKSRSDEHHQLFAHETEQLYTYNFLICLWSLVSVAGCMYVLIISDRALVQSYIVISFSAFQIASSILGFVSVRLRHVQMMRWYFIAHFTEVVVTSITVAWMIAYYHYIRVYIDRNWDQPWMIHLKDYYCAELNSFFDDICQQAVTDALRTLILVCLIGASVACCLLLLSVRSAMGVIPLEGLERHFALLMLSCMVNLLIGTLIVFLVRVFFTILAFVHSFLTKYIMHYNRQATN